MLDWLARDASRIYRERLVIPAELAWQKGPTFQTVCSAILSMGMSRGCHERMLMWCLLLQHIVHAPWTLS